MRKKSLLITATAAIVYLTVSSYSGGPAHNGTGNMTGGPGSAGNCGSCHVGGGGTTTGTIEVRKKSLGPTSTPVTSYVAGETYIITISGGNPTAGLDDFGFQFTALKSSDNTTTGTYSNLGTMVHGFPATNSTLVEHNAPIPKTGGVYEISFDWTAPTTTVGGINMYAIINAVNKDVTISGDKPSSTISLALADATSVATVTSEVVVKAYPNPVADVLTIDLNKADAGTYTVLAYTTNGSLVSKAEMNIGPGNYAGSINTSAWAPGLYFVQLQKDGYKHVMPVVKQ
jgi:hypothetical protein